VSDGCGEAADGSQAVLHAHLAFQAADFGEIVKGVDKAQVAAGAHIERRHAHAKSLVEPVAGVVADFGITAVSAEMGNGS